MRTSEWKIISIFLISMSLAIFCSTAVLAKQSGHPGGEAAGNNLSFPVIWSDGVTKVLRGTAGVYKLDGAMWYWWGTDADGNPESCLADSDDQDWCDDGENGTVGPAPCEDRTDPDCMAVFQQQDSNSEWQAGSADWSGSQVHVDWIDWGDNLESVDWYTRSKVRTEVVLIQDLPGPMLQYGIRHLEGWGISELWGLATIGLSWAEDPDETVYYTYPEELVGMQATVYSGCARLTIQKLLKPREDILPEDLTWKPETGQWEGEFVKSPIFNLGVWEGGDGPGYYSAEINVKGKVIYGYTWDVRYNNDGAGDYRITFSLDPTENCPVALNTFFVEGETEILLPVEEETIVEEESEEPGGGAVGVLRPDLNLTYMDVRILERDGGKPEKIK